MFERLNFLVHVASTVAMVGVMWAVQLVIYPQFRTVGEAAFEAHIGDHSTRIVALLALFAPAEVITSFLLWLNPPAGVSKTLAFVAGLILALLWVATGLWYGPFHGRLQTSGADLAMIDQLVRANWLRTIGWTVRGGMVMWMLWQVLDLAGER